MHRAIGVAALAAVALASVACSSDDDDDGSVITNAVEAASTGATVTSLEPESTAAADSATTAATADSDTTSANGGETAATGEPIALMVISPQTTQPQYPERLVAARAAAAAINARGGVAGRPIEILVCDTKNGAADEENCARELASSDAVAAIDAIVGRTTALNDIAAQEGIASIGVSGIGPSDLAEASAASFPLTVGYTSLFGCPEALAAAGATKIGGIAYSGGSGEAFLGGLQAVIANVPDIAYTTGSLVELSATDFAGPVQTLIDNGTDGLVLGVGEPAAISIIRANGGRMKMCTASSIVSDANLSELGAAAEGWTIMSSSPPLQLVEDSGSLGAQFVADLDAYFEETDDVAAAPDARKEGSLGAWMAVQAFAIVAEDLPEITRESVLEAFTNETALEMEGLLPNPVNFTELQPVPNLARLFVPEYNSYVWSADEGTYRTDVENINVIDLLTAGSTPTTGG